ncbi:SHOCT domain-containing protein [Haladaptatus sp. DJG-WS-42]|uniref:SHOCT domain-containing protein n=1 Tax=Haladaptatus sp. DJG-WS-42 TaxID=3120516 RepID=UPI0030CAE2A5
MTTTTQRQLLWVALAILAALLILPALLMGFGMMGYGPMMGGFWGGGFGMNSGTIPGWMMAVGFLMQLLFFIAIIGGGYLLVRAVTGTQGSDRALDELRLAYARGDLTDEEYDERKRRLEADRR